MLSFRLHQSRPEYSNHRVSGKAGAVQIVQKLNGPSKTALLPEATGQRSFQLSNGYDSPVVWAETVISNMALPDKPWFNQGSG